MEKYINKAVFVIKYEQTNSKIVENAVEKIQKAGINILGGMISQYQPKCLAYGRYGYYKNYNYYGSDSEDKK